MKRLLAILLLAITTLSSWSLQPERGYRGFIDSNNFLDINMGFLVGGGSDSYVSTGFTTSHGYQFNSWLYVGGGTGFVYNLNWKPLAQAHKNDKSRYVIPLFAEVRLDAKWNRFTPYFSAQVGANVAERGGFYFSPMIGYRFNWGRRSAINIGLGATLYGNTYSYLDHTYVPGVGHIDEAVKRYDGNVVSFTARLGFEFQLP